MADVDYIEWWNFQFAPNNHNRFFFLQTWRLFDQFCAFEKGSARLGSARLLSTPLLDMWFRQYCSQMKRAWDSSIHRLEKGQTTQKRKITIPTYNKHQGSSPRIITWGGPAKTPLCKRLQKSMFIVTLRSNIRFKVDGYETPVTLGQKYICVFQVSRSYLGFCPDLKYFVVKCEHNLSNMLENGGKCSEKCSF